MKTVANLLAILSLFASGYESGAQETTSGYLRYSFETDAEIREWTCGPGVAANRSREYATDGVSSMKVSVPPKAPWFGISRDIDMAELRKAEFLEFDLCAATPINYLAVMMRGGGFQDLQITYDLLEAREKLHIRIRLSDNEMVRFGKKVGFSIWCANPTDRTISFYVDNMRLTGFGGTKGQLDLLKKNIDRREKLVAASKDTGLVKTKDDLLEEINRQLAANSVADETVTTLKDKWSQILQKATTGGSTATPPPFLVGVESSMVKVRRVQSLTDFSGQLPGRSIDLSLARNEYEGKQVVFFPLRHEPVEALEVHASDLVCRPSKPADASVVIPAANIEVRLVGEVNIGGTTQFPGEQLTGNYPDPLLPNAAFVLAPGESRALWVTVFAPANCAPGQYQGKLTITQKGKPVGSLPLNVRVWDFTLPTQSSLKTLFNVWSHNWVNFYRYNAYPDSAWFQNPSFSDVPPEQVAKLIDFCNRYRLAATGMLTYGFQSGRICSPVRATNGAAWFSDWDDRAAQILKYQPLITGVGISGETFDWNKKQVDGTTTATFTNFLAQLNQHVQERGWSNRIYCYLMDEPRGEERVRVAFQEAKLVKQTAPNLKTLMTSCTHLVPLDDPNLGLVDTWVTLMDRTPIRLAHEYQKRGKEVFWYGANVIYAPFPNWAIHYDGMAPRMMPLITFKYKMDGILDWSINLWGEENVTPKNTTRWPDREWTCKGWMYQPGEGHLYYPGRNGDSWSSIRLENWRDGMEDYEYLVLLQQRLPTLTGNDRTQADRLLSLNGIVEAPYDFTRNPEVIEQWRYQIAKLIEKGNKP